MHHHRRDDDFLLVNGIQFSFPLSLALHNIIKTDRKRRIDVLFLCRQFLFCLSLPVVAPFVISADRRRRRQHRNYNCTSEPLVSETVQAARLMTDRAAYCFQTVTNRSTEKRTVTANQVSQENFLKTPTITSTFAWMLYKWFDLLLLLLHFPRPFFLSLGQRLLDYSHTSTIYSHVQTLTVLSVRSLTNSLTAGAIPRLLVKTWFIQK